MRAESIGDLGHHALADHDGRRPIHACEQQLMRTCSTERPRWQSGRQGPVTILNPFAGACLQAIAPVRNDAGIQQRLLHRTRDAHRQRPDLRPAGDAGFHGHVQFPIMREPTGEGPGDSRKRESGHGG